MEYKSENGWNIELTIKHVLPHYGRRKKWPKEWIDEMDTWLSHLVLTSSSLGESRSSFSTSLEFESCVFQQGNVEIQLNRYKPYLVAKSGTNVIESEYNRYLGHNAINMTNVKSVLEKIYEWSNIKKTPFDIWISLFHKVCRATRCDKNFLDVINKVWVELKKVHWLLKPSSWDHGFLSDSIYQKSGDIQWIPIYFSNVPGYHHSRFLLSLEIKCRLILSKLLSIVQECYLTNLSTSVLHFLKTYRIDFCKKWVAFYVCGAQHFGVIKREHKDDDIMQGYSLCYNNCISDKKISSMLSNIVDVGTNIEELILVIKMITIMNDELSNTLFDNNNKLILPSDEKVLEQGTTFGKLSLALKKAREILTPIIPKDILNLILEGARGPLKPPL
jgi:hypothetical protein